MITGQKLFTLERRTEELLSFLDKMVGNEEPPPDLRLSVMEHVHALNEAYVAWANEVDNAELVVVD